MLGIPNFTRLKLLYTMDEPSEGLAFKFAIVASRIPPYRTHPYIGCTLHWFRRYLLCCILELLLGTLIDRTLIERKLIGKK
jgi:hypothetical protein